MTTDATAGKPRAPKYNDVHQSSAREADRIALVDQLWKLKKHWQEHTGRHVPLNVLIKEVDYRRDVLDRAINSGDSVLASLATRIVAIEERIGEISSINPENVRQKPSKMLFAGALLALLTVLAMIGALVYQAVGDAETLLPADNPQVAFRLHGSNTVGEQLAPALLKAFLESQESLKTLVVDTNVPVERQVQYVLPEKDLVPRAVELHAHGSSTAFEDLAKGKTDVGMSSRAIKPNEVDALREMHGDLSAAGREYVIALDGLAVIVNRANPVTALSKATIARIFAGDIQNWEELGAPPGPINVHARDDNSGTYDTFKSLVLKPGGTALAETATRYESSTELSDAVAADPYAIGFIGLPYVRHAKAVGVAESEDTAAIVPSEFTVSTEDYPLSRRLYFYLPANSANRLSRDFVRFAVSDAGQKVVESSGLVSQRIRTERTRLQQDAPARFQELTRDAERLSVTLRFDADSGHLDNKALQDIDRIVDFMARNPQRELMLFGFADNSGNLLADSDLAAARARIAAQPLTARGLYPSVVEGFGSALPIAPNDSSAGQQKNRRVEVWIR